jgi:hypothetical protein
MRLTSNAAQASGMLALSPRPGQPQRWGPRLSRAPRLDTCTGVEKIRSQLCGGGRQTTIVLLWVKADMTG